MDGRPHLHNSSLLMQLLDEVSVAQRVWLVKEMHRCIHGTMGSMIYLTPELTKATSVPCRTEKGPESDAECLSFRNAVE